MRSTLVGWAKPRRCRGVPNKNEQEHKIFTELGFTRVDDGCDGFCPECEQMTTCQVYKEELKEEWERFYS